MPVKLPLRAAEELLAAERRLRKSHALVGLDGFVDTILHVVDKRQSATRYRRLETITAFADRIRAAAGHSGNIEMVTQMVKLGGNGPIMANALGALGAPITYIGNLGKPSIHPAFEDFVERARVFSVAEPGYTDAVEFADGKLMLGKHESLRQVNWRNLILTLPEARLIQLVAEASLVALTNWTMLTEMNGILTKMLARIAPAAAKEDLPGGEPRRIFFDLADPAKRTAEDIAGVLKLIARFEKYFRVILGLNFREGIQVGAVLGLKTPAEKPDAVAEHAAAIRTKLRIDTVVIHPTAFASAADPTGTAGVHGPFTPKPKITTGAGDHFNAGFCTGRVLGLPLDSCLQLGVATSGSYVRTAASPRLKDLAAFLRTLAK